MAEEEQTELDLSPLEEAVASFPESQDSDVDEIEDEIDIEAAQDEEGDDDGLDDLEIGSEKHRVPRAVKEAWSGLQASTQKERESLKAQAAEQKGAMALTSNFLKDIAKIQNIDTQLEPYKNLTSQDWIQWANEDSEKASQAQIGIKALDMEREKLVLTVERSERERVEKVNQERMHYQEAGERELKLQIKNWSPEKSETLKSVAKDSGFSKEELGPLAYDPRVMKVLDELREYREIKAKVSKRTAMKKDDPTPTPTPRSRSKTPTQGLRDSQNIDDWAAKFDQERARHTGRR
jgi:hypothetical protein